MNEGVAETLKRASGLRAKEDRANALRSASSAALKNVLGFCFDPRIVWKLPEGEPPYKAAAKGQDIQNVLKADHRRMFAFIDAQGFENLPQAKRELMFIQMLETVDPDDAALLVAIKDRKMPYKGITLEVVKMAFPKLAKDW